MIIEREKQIDLLTKYIKEGHSTDECCGFVDGLNAMMELVNKLMKEEIDENGRYKKTNSRR